MNFGKNPQHDFPKMRGVNGRLELFRKFIRFGRAQLPLALFLVLVGIFSFCCSTCLWSVGLLVCWSSKLMLFFLPSVFLSFELLLFFAFGHLICWSFELFLFVLPPTHVSEWVIVSDIGDCYRIFRAFFCFWSWSIFWADAYSLLPLLLAKVAEGGREDKPGKLQNNCMQCYRDILNVPTSTMSHCCINLKCPCIAMFNGIKILKYHSLQTPASLQCEEIH